MNGKLAARIVAEDEDGMRLDRWFKTHFPDLKFGRLQKLLRSGQIRLDGARAKANVRICPGQSVRVPPGVLDDAHADARPPPERRGIEAKDRDFLKSLVLHKDERILVINKPPGLAVQGGTGQSRHLDAMLEGLKFRASMRPRLVHRLDKDTSGVLVLARDRLAARYMAELLKSRKTKKLYWALTCGVPRPLEGEVENRIEKSGGPGRQRMEEASDDRRAGVRAITQYQVIDQAANRFAWVALQPVTGRTHQLRVHAALMQCPIAGDGKYGGRAAHPGGDISSKLHLHARSISFPHPDRGVLRVEAPMPEHMLSTWGLLGFETAGVENPFDRE